VAVHLLKKVPILQHLPDNALRRLTRITRSHSFRKGERIIAQKEAGEHLYVVATGKVKIFVAAGVRKQKTYAIVEKGEFFGELALLDGAYRTASAEAVDDTTLLLVPKREFQKLLQKDPAFTMLLLRTLAERLRKANETIESLLFKNILGRVAKVLVDLNNKELGENATTTTPLHVTHRELAQWVGTSREPLSRALAVLRRGGFIATNQGSIEISKLDKLKQLVEA
jgi:CRP-like cAMP-binding protein